MLLQVLRLRHGLYALGHDAQVQVVCHVDDGSADGRVIGVAGDIAHERTVDFQYVDGEALDVTEARLAGAEVIDRNADAEMFDTLQHGNE